MKETVTKEWIFHAAHRDVTAPEGDQCGRLHGHSYRLKVEVTGKTDKRGMVLHGDLLKQIYAEKIEPHVEHRFLNETLHFNPVMEALAAWACAQFKDAVGKDYQVCVELWETPTMSAVAKNGYELYS